MSSNKQKGEKKAGESDSAIRQRIIVTAAEIMNRKGFSETNISEISSVVGINDPTIYQHFSGKEDILFAIVEKYMGLFLQFLDEHLQGISGVYDQLRKLVWAHLKFNDTNREYMTLVLLECRSNVNFYQTKAYDLIQDYAHILTKILREGREKGVFRSDIHISLIRDMIFGLVDFEAIACLVTKEMSEATPDHEECMDLIGRAILTKDKDDKIPDNTRYRILQAAKISFAENGYKKATISQIARQAGVADGTVYEYFQNKEDLLFSIPREYFAIHKSQLEAVFNIKSSEKMLRRFIMHHFSIYLTDPNLLKIYLSLILLNRRFYQSPSYQDWLNYIEFLDDIVRKGVNDGSFAEDSNIKIFRNMFLGSFTHMAIRWFFARQNKLTDRFSEIKQITDLLISALVK